MLKLNKFKSLTTQHYGVNYFFADDDLLNFEINPFDDYSILNTKNVFDVVDYPKNNIGEVVNSLVPKSNFKKEIVFDGDTKNAVQVNLDFSQNLIGTLAIKVLDNVKAKLVLRCIGGGDINNVFTLKIDVGQNSTLNFDLLDDLVSAKCDLFGIEANCETNSQLNLNVFNFGCQNSVQNIVANLNGDLSRINLNSVYFGTKTDRLGINYLFNNFGKKSVGKMNVFGVLDQNAQKNFVGTIDFKKGAKKSVGTEAEYCMLLSNNVVAKSTPVLLCAEEDVDGSHSSSAGKVSDEELFYVLSRGLPKPDATKLLVKAKLSTFVNAIFDDDLKQQVLNLVDKRI